MLRDAGAAFRQCLRKDMRNARFVCAVLVTAVLCLSTMGYMDGDQRAYSVLELFLYRPQGAAGLTSGELFEMGLGHYVALFIPLVTALPFSHVFCMELASGAYRLSLCRCGHRAYWTGQFLAAAVTGGGCTALGYGLYGLVVWTAFPSGGETAALQALAAAFLYGMFSTVTALAFTVFFRNPYLVCCLPFIYNYMKDSFLRRMPASWGILRVSAVMRAAYDPVDGLPGLLLHLTVGICGAVLFVAVFSRTERR